MTAKFGLVLKNGRLDDGRAVDIGLRAGKVGEIVAAGELPFPGAVDLGGGLVLPALIDGHIHLDKTYLGLPWLPHRPDTTVRGRIEAEKAVRRTITEPMPVRARRMVEHVAVRGTGVLRSHVDVDAEMGLSGVNALLALRDQVGHLVDLQLVAFPQSGIVSAPGVAALMDEALRLGCDVVGGLDPAGYDGTIDGQLDIVFDLAERHDRPIDIHLHDQGTLGAFQLVCIADRAKAAGWQGRVAVSHAFCLGAIDAARLARTADALAEGGVAIMTNGPGPETIPPIKTLRRHGVEVFVGSDNIRDAWSPYGNGDMLDRARLVGYRAALLTDDDLRLAFDLVTGAGARVMRRAIPQIAVGAPADLIVVDAAHIPEALATVPPRRLVIKHGRIVARDGTLT